MDPELIRMCFQQGLMGVEIPEEYGGAGLDLLASCAVIEELARVDPAVSVMVDVQNTLINNALLRWGTPDQKSRWLPRLATDTLGSFCLSEASSGSDAFALKTTAKESGSDYILNGNKLWITNAKEAGLFLVMANVDHSKGYKGLTCFVVERDTPGLSIGKKEDKLGIRASSTCEVVLEDCKVSKDNILGPVGKGYKIAIEALNEGRIGIGAQMVGLARGAFEFAMPYIMQRQQFGQPVASFQGMQFQYARAAMEIETARLLVYEAALLKQNGMDFVKSAAMAKLHASEVANRVSTSCIEWLGGVGFTKEYQAEKFYRDSIIGKIYEGTSNIQLQGIAKILQKEYGSS